MPSPHPRVDGALLLVVPTFNNASTIVGVLQGLLSLGVDLLVVDDGSTDATAALLCAQFSSIKTLHHSHNSGKGAALKTAGRYAMQHGYDAMLSCDADGQFSEADVRLLVEAYNAHPDELIIGARRFDGPKAGDVPGGARFGRSFSNFWVWVESGRWLADTQSGLRLYPLHRMARFGLERAQRYDFEIEVLVHAIWQGITVRSVPVGVHYPFRRERISHFRPIVDNFRLTLLHTRLTCTRIIPSWGKSHGERRGAHLLWLLYRLAGRRLCYVMCALPLFFYFVTGGSARRGIRALRARLHGSHGVFWGRSFMHYFYFAISLIDRLALVSAKKKADVLSHISPQSLAMIKQIAPGSILIGAHYGDWLICGAALAAHSTHRLKIVMDARRTPHFNALMAGMDRSRVQFIDSSVGGLPFVLQLKEALAAGELVCMMGDRNDGSDTGIQVEFLGEPAIFPRSPFALARALGGAIYFFTSTKSAPRPSAPYRITFHQLSEAGQRPQVDQLAGAYARILEASVRAEPCHWFNFYDFWGCRCPTQG